MTLNNFEGLSWSTLYYAIKIDEKLSIEGKYWDPHKSYVFLWGTYVVSELNIYKWFSAEIDLFVIQHALNKCNLVITYFKDDLIAQLVYLGVMVWTNLGVPLSYITL